MFLLLFLLLCILLILLLFLLLPQGRNTTSTLVSVSGPRVGQEQDLAGCQEKKVSLGHNLAFGWLEVAGCFLLLLLLALVGQRYHAGGEPDLVQGTPGEHRVCH